ncbi:MAG: hypothetical protein ABEJ91_02775 [Candidatus Nanohaloarchaea archaeon]
MALVVLASGCAHTDGGNGQESSRAITVESFTVTPKTVYAGTTARVSLDMKNTGNLPADVYMGKKGRRVLKDYCPDIFNISENGFSVVTSGERKGNTVLLKPGDEISMRWRLRQTGDVPLYGYKCDMDAQVPFNYSVQSYRQVQVKKSREVQGSPELHWESSSGPMQFAIETTGGVEQGASTFIAPSGDERTVTILLQLQNSGVDGYRKGVIDVQESSLAIKATEPLKLDEGFTRINPDRITSRLARGLGISQENYEELTSDTGEWTAYGYDNPRCDMQSSDQLRMFEGESRMISCNVPLPQKSELDAPSEISEIFAQVNYTYMKEVGTRTVEVKPRGG